MATMRSLLASAQPPLTFDNLCPHVKTHKSVWTTQKQMAAGISFFKSTLNELHMLIAAGAPKIFIAYPLLEADAAEVAVLIAEHPQIEFFVQASQPRHVEILRRFSSTRWNLFIDVNVGMNRTGLAAQDAWSFYQGISGCATVNVVGIHAYDGHVHQCGEDLRKQAAAESMRVVIELVRQFAQNGRPPAMTMVAGTPSFLPDMQLLGQATLPTKLLFSPGTWIYSDSLTNEMLPGFFEIAAVLLTQVIDLPTPRTATLNIGHKRWAVDQGAIDSFSVPGMKAVSWNEEHTVVAVPDGMTLNIGDYVSAAPRHVCSTVNLWEYAVLIDAQGSVVRDLKIEARNR